MTTKLDFLRLLNIGNGMHQNNSSTIEIHPSLTISVIGRFNFKILPGNIEHFRITRQRLQESVILAPKNNSV